MEGGEAIRSRYGKKRRGYGFGWRARKSRLEVITLGAGSIKRNRSNSPSKRRRRRKWFNSISPKKFFSGIRDGYTKMMLSFAKSRAINSGLCYDHNGSVDNGFCRSPLKEYDNKVIVEIYKELMVQAQLAELVPGLDEPISTKPFCPGV